MTKSRKTYHLPPGTDFTRCHCHSEIGDPWPPLEPDELDALLANLYSGATFSEIGIVAFSLRPRGFDLIIDIPTKIRLSKKEMLARFKDSITPVIVDREMPLLKRNDTAAWDRLRSRFGDISPFMKNLKQVATQTYHRKRSTSGTLWSKRFDRVLLQPGHTSRVLAAWIDHAGVRDGRFTSPAEDRHCTFGSAVAGDKRARNMIRTLFLADAADADWRRTAAAYRDFISQDTPPEIALKGNKGKPPLTRPELLITEVESFENGVALGDRAFVERFFEFNRAAFGPNRRTGARHVSGQNDPDLWAIRQKPDLRKIRS
jgi:hypothetical protein